MKPSRLLVICIVLLLAGAYVGCGTPTPAPSATTSSSSSSSSSAVVTSTASTATPTAGLPHDVVFEFDSNGTTVLRRTVIVIPPQNNKAGDFTIKPGSLPTDKVPLTLKKDILPGSKLYPPDKKTDATTLLTFVISPSILSAGKPITTFDPSLRMTLEYNASDYDLACSRVKCESNQPPPLRVINLYKADETWHWQGLDNTKVVCGGSSCITGTLSAEISTLQPDDPEGTGSP